MNREIEFRSYYNNKSMLYSSAYINLFYFFELQPERFPLMQFTGLTDKNGVKIFEGDILKVGEHLTCEIIYISENVDDYGDEINCAFHAKIYKQDKTIPLDGYLKKNCRIIGNIYENKNLIL